MAAKNDPEAIATPPHSRLDPRVRIALEALLVAGLVVGLYLSRVASYLLFHSIVETFSIVIGVAVFIITWNTREQMDNNYLLFLGISFLFVAILDFLHLLAYTGMGVFQGYGTNLATQLWIAARYMQALAFLIAPFLLGRKMRAGLAFCCFAAVEAALVALIFTRTFPTMFVEGAGLTGIKNWSEYIICAIIVVAIALLWWKRDAFEPRVMWLLFASMGVTIISELCFTFYKHPYSWPNFLGHVFKVVAFYLIYRAIVETGLRRPMDLLFRDLRMNEEDLMRKNVELEGLAYSVSHDLRGPLAAIGIAGRMAGESAEAGIIEAEEVSDLSLTIERSLEKSFALIDDLLAFANADQQPEKLEVVNLDKTVRNIREERAALIRERGAHVEIDGELGTASMNPTHAYQVFSNLIGNAIVHNDSPEPRVVIRHARDEAAPTPGRFAVCDNGPGIPDEVADSIFEPFVKGPRGGTGIGLATVSKIVGLYGGEITFSTNGGTCFEFDLPTDKT